MNNNIPDTQPKDAGLREAVARRTRRCPQMPADLNERLMERVEEVRPKHSSALHRWMWPSVAACMVAALIVGHFLLDGSSKVAPTASMQGTQVIYASATDTAYKSPVLVDEFIARLAAKYAVEQELPDSIAITDAGVVSFVYVFPEYKEADVLARMQHVACTYSHNAPGHLLHLTKGRLLFKLQDAVKGRQHLWMVEEIGANTLVYGINSPLATTVSYASYADYREKCLILDIQSKFYNF